MYCPHVPQILNAQTSNETIFSPVCFSFIHCSLADTIPLVHLPYTMSYLPTKCIPLNICRYVLCSQKLPNEIVPVLNFYKIFRWIQYLYVLNIRAYVVTGQQDRKKIIWSYRISSFIQIYFWKLLEKSNIHQCTARSISFVLYKEHLRSALPY